MPAIDQDGLAPDEARAVRAALARDPALADELDLILPALSASGRRAFLRAFAGSCAAGGRPAAAVLEALVATAERR
ncbi:MAG TPA: hypothetical protein VFS73_04515 [Solirubrobacterales bacterium]|jgi:hypothetical protein|nr:hypothetical protein [Solirubrobacterales bacterium]